MKYIVLILLLFSLTSFAKAPAQMGSLNIIQSERDDACKKGCLVAIMAWTQHIKVTKELWMFCEKICTTIKKEEDKKYGDGKI